MIRALLFDFDGVVVDTEVATYRAWADVYAEHGAELSLEDYLPAVGTGSSVASPFDAIAHLERLVGSPVDREELIARRARRKAELYERAPLLAGVRHLPIIGSPGRAPGSRRASRRRATGGREPRPRTPRRA